MAGLSRVRVKRCRPYGANGFVLGISINMPRLRRLARCKTDTKGEEAARHRVMVLRLEPAVPAPHSSFAGDTANATGCELNAERWTLIVEYLSCSGGL
jgi:hypothetical protein